MKQKMLGSTAISVSMLGLGTVKFGRNQGVKYPHNFEIPDDSVLLNLIAFAKDNGINLLDTAPAYGNSETRLGELLKKDRKNWIISTKVGEEFDNGKSTYIFDAKHVEKSIERSLERLKTDYIDILLVHSNGDDLKIIEEKNIFQTLQKIKQSGKIRAYGMSTKTISGGLQTLKHSDLAMVTYNVLETDEKKIIAAARRANKGIFIKKAFASGHLQQLNLQNPIYDSLEFIFKHPGVTSIILGTINQKHLEYNIQCANQILG